MLFIGKSLFLTLLVSILFSSYSPAQKFLALDVYHITGNMKRIRFYEGNNISFRLQGSRKFFTHTITFIGDSSIVLDTNWILPLREIDRMKINRISHLAHTVSIFLVDCGIGFFVLDSFNALTNDEKPILRAQTAEESAVLILSGLILRRVMIRKYHIGHRRALKIIDISP